MTVEKRWGVGEGTFPFHPTVEETEKETILPFNNKN